MTLTQSDVTELLDAIRAGGDIDVIRKGVELVLQALIDAEATEHIDGAARADGADRSRRVDDASQVFIEHVSGDGREPPHLAHVPEAGLGFVGEVLIVTADLRNCSATVAQWHDHELAGLHRRSEVAPVGVKEPESLFGAACELRGLTKPAA